MPGSREGADPRPILQRQRERLHDLIGDIFPWASEEMAGMQGYAPHRVPIRHQGPAVDGIGPVPPFFFASYTLIRTWTRTRIHSWLEHTEDDNGSRTREMRATEHEEQQIVTTVLVTRKAVLVVHRMTYSYRSSIGSVLAGITHAPRIRGPEPHVTPEGVREPEGTPLPVTALAALPEQPSPKPVVTVLGVTPNMPRRDTVPALGPVTPPATGATPMLPGHSPDPGAARPRTALALPPSSRSGHTALPGSGAPGPTAEQGPR